MAYAFSFRARGFEDNPECTELLLQLIIKKSSFRVDQVKAMWYGSSAGLDILATNNGGWSYKIRVFRDDTADRKQKKGTELFQAEFSVLVDNLLNNFHTFPK